MSDVTFPLIPNIDELILEPREYEIYSQPFLLGELSRLPGSGSEIYVIEYPAGLTNTVHMHSSNQSILILSGMLKVNGEVMQVGAWCQLPANVPHKHEPAGSAPCRFVVIFDGPFDVQLAE